MQSIVLIFLTTTLFVTDNATYHIDYSAIGMDDYSPSVALALARKYKKWNLFFYDATSIEVQ